MFAGDDIPTEVCGAKYSALSNIDRSLALAAVQIQRARVFNLANIADVYNISHIGWRATGCLLLLTSFAQYTFRVLVISKQAGNKEILLGKVLKLALFLA
jgi:hypothetical protein